MIMMLYSNDIIISAQIVNSNSVNEKMRAHAHIPTHHMEFIACTPPQFSTPDLLNRVRKVQRKENWLLTRSCKCCLSLTDTEGVQLIEQVDECVKWLKVGRECNPLVECSGLSSIFTRSFQVYGCIFECKFNYDIFTDKLQITNLKTECTLSVKGFPR